MLGLNQGFPLEKPPITIPWGLSRSELFRLLGPYGVRRVRPVRHALLGHYAMPCVALNGLSHDLEIHFDFNCGPAKYWFGFVRRDFPDKCKIHTEFRRHLEAVFGAPTESEPFDELFGSDYWKFNGFVVSHMTHRGSVTEEGLMIKPRGYGRSKIGRRLEGFREAFFGPLWPLTVGYIAFMGMILLLICFILRRW